MSISSESITPEDSLSDEEWQLLEKLLQKAAKNSRVKCAGALAIADSLGISSGEVGRVANRLNIKISSCQLGCF